MAEKRTAKDAKSDKHAKFRDLAQSRTGRALVSIARIGNLSNRQLYEWEDAEVKKVLKALRDAVSEIEIRFNTVKGKADAKFRF